MGHGSQGFDFGMPVSTEPWVPDPIHTLCYHLVVKCNDRTNGEIAFLLCLESEVDGTAEVPFFIC